jgi:hypothetical protein
LNVRRGIALMLGGSLVVISWSWIGGFVLARLSRRAILMNGALFCLVLVFGELLAAPKYHEIDGALMFCVKLTLISPTALVLLPSRS